MKMLSLCLLVAVTVSSCMFVGSRNVRVDPRTEFPEARPYDGSQRLPGDVPVTGSDLRGAWFFRQPLQSRDPLFSNAFFHALWLWIREDGTYDLVYQASEGSRARNSPAFRAVDVRESGRFSISGGTLSLEPATTRAVELRQGGRRRTTLGNEPRDYVARVDGGYLNLAGPCATYQIEPICRDSDVWISLRSVSIESPDDVPEL